MAKKSFKNSPAMQFLSVLEPSEPEAAPEVPIAAKQPGPEAAPEVPIAAKQPGPVAAPEVPIAAKQTAVDISEKKQPELKPAAEVWRANSPLSSPAKTRGGEAQTASPLVPATRPNSQPTTTLSEAEPPQPPAAQASHVPMKPNPAYIETRSKRVQLLMQPSVHGQLRALALKRKVSLNDLVHNALEDYLFREEG